MGRILTEKQKDRVADKVIRVGGILVIVVVLAIVANIGLEALPLFFGAESGPLSRLPLNPAPLAAGSDARRETVWTLAVDGKLRVHYETGEVELEVFDEACGVVDVDQEIYGLVAVLGDSGEVAVGSVRFRDTWSEGERTTAARWRSAAEPLRMASAPAAGSEHQDASPRWSSLTANADADGNLLVALWTQDGELDLAWWDGEDEQWSRRAGPAGLRAARVAINQELDHMAVVEPGGSLRIFRLPTLDEVEVDGVRGPVSAARFLIGGGSLVVAEASGELGVMLLVPRVRVENIGAEATSVVGLQLAAGEAAVVDDDEVGRRLASRTDVTVSAAPAVGRVVRHLPGLGAEPTVITPSNRRRGFLVGAMDGTISLYHSTSARRLLRQSWSDQPIKAVAMDPKGDGAVAVAGSEVLHRSISNPHPEVSLRTLFLPVWYEGYAARKWVWQSTGGSDAFEPKMSLWPLIFGTLKATFYAMIFSLPLALLAAVYISQLAPPWLQSVVKPTVELMAAVPSVVVGFLAALWLAPRLEQALLASLLGLLCLPLAILVALLLWRAIPGGMRRRVPAGGELLLLLVASAVVLVSGWLLSGPVEQWLFGGDFQRFLFTEWGLRYDQRNSLVVGLALGFAVIPVIFTIAEDACSAVPKNLVTASRALGATRWQTAVKLVVPAASPGLFAAVMLGLGRAVGETMIVLMAAGNTPLLDLSAFNGMRTMSAAIAVEIPEAPVGGTLFRVLFLTGTLLFIFTLVLTTAADVVGSYLRRRYARF